LLPWDEDVRFVDLRLSALPTTVDGYHEVKLELCEARGAGFGFQRDTVEEILRAIGECDEKAVDEGGGRG
jgi:hypothetical protein